MILKIPWLLIFIFDSVVFSEPIAEASTQYAKSNVLNNESNCVCFDEQPSSKTIAELLDPENEGFERLVMYYYRTFKNDKIYVYIPNKAKQYLIPDVVQEDGDILIPVYYNQGNPFFPNNCNSIYSHQAHVSMPSDVSDLSSEPSSEITEVERQHGEEFPSLSYEMYTSSNYPKLDTVNVISTFNDTQYYNSNSTNFIEQALSDKEQSKTIKSPKNTYPSTNYLKWHPSGNNKSVSNENRSYNSWNSTHSSKYGAETGQTTISKSFQETLLPNYVEWSTSTNDKSDPKNNRLHSSDLIQFNLQNSTPVLSTIPLDQNTPESYSTNVQRASDTKIDSDYTTNSPSLSENSFNSKHSSSSTVQSKFTLSNPDWIPFTNDKSTSNPSNEYADPNPFSEKNSSSVQLIMPSSKHEAYLSSSYSKWIPSTNDTSDLNSDSNYNRESTPFTELGSSSYFSTRYPEFLISINDKRTENSNKSSNINNDNTDQSSTTGGGSSPDTLSFVHLWKIPQPGNSSISYADGISSADQKLISNDYSSDSTHFFLHSSGHEKLTPFVYLKDEDEEIKRVNQTTSLTKWVLGEIIANDFQSINVTSLERKIIEILSEYAISEGPDGVLFDSGGQIFNMSVLCLRPIYIGDNVEFHKIISQINKTIHIPPNLRYQKMLMLSFVDPPKVDKIKVLGIIPMETIDAQESDENTTAQSTATKNHEDIETTTHVTEVTQKTAPPSPTGSHWYEYPEFVKKIFEFGRKHLKEKSQNNKTTEKSKNLAEISNKEHNLPIIAPNELKQPNNSVVGTKFTTHWSRGVVNKRKSASSREQSLNHKSKTRHKLHSNQLSNSSGSKENAIRAHGKLFHDENKHNSVKSTSSKGNSSEKINRHIDRWNREFYRPKVDSNRNNFDKLHESLSGKVNADSKIELGTQERILLPPIRRVSSNLVDGNSLYEYDDTYFNQRNEFRRSKPQKKKRLSHYKNKRKRKKYPDTAGFYSDNTSPYEDPDFRIIGGAAATFSGLPISNRGRAGYISA